MTWRCRSDGSKKNFAVLDLFSGIGGFSLGLEAAGPFRTVAFCEQDAFCQAVLRKHWPDTPIYDDVRTINADGYRGIDILSAAAFRVNRGPQPGSSEARKMTVTSGRSWLPLLQTYGLNGSLARMCEALLTSRWASSAVFLTWKASGIKPRHLLFQLAPLMPRTEGIASGLWPTPTAQDNPQVRGVGKTKGTKRGTTLGGAVRMWPTPAAHEARLGYQDRTRGKKGTQKSLTTEVIDDMGGRQATIGQLNPTWVEWLMGFPTGWTDLKPSEMQSSRRSSRKSDAQSSQQRARNVR